MLRVITLTEPVIIPVNPDVGLNVLVVNWLRKRQQLDKESAESEIYVKNE